MEDIMKKLCLKKTHRYLLNIFLSVSPSHGSFIFLESVATVGPEYVVETAAVVNRT